MKYRFASSEWFAALHAILCERARELAKARPDFAYSICELITGVPPELATLPGRRTAWRASFRGAEVTFERNDSDDVDFKTISDYESILPLSRFDTLDDPDRAAQLRELSQDLIASGKLQMIGAPVKGLGPLRSVHDAIAKLTA